MGQIKFSGGGCSSCGDMGALAAKVDAKNQRTEYEYDNRGRLKKIKYPSSNDYVEFTYDAALLTAPFSSR